jgi:hypothetical protein
VAYSFKDVELVGEELAEKGTRSSMNVEENKVILLQKKLEALMLKAHP